MLSKRQIVCFAPTDWWSMNPSCTSHIMSHLAATNRVLFINPIGSDLLAFKGSQGRKNILVRIYRKLTSWAKWLKKPQENLYVLSPVFVPIQGTRLTDGLNNLLLWLQIKGVCKVLGIRRPILWLENPRAADTVDWFKPEATVYHVSDLFGLDGYVSNKQKQMEREAALSERSDLLVCVSRRLYEFKRQTRDNVHYLPHGVDYELFRQAAEDPQPLPELEDVPKPIAGYFGTMTANNDIEMMLYCARSLPHVSFVFAGQITTGDYSQLRALPNVFLLGRLAYEKVPALCASFDVCMLQWKMTEWIEHCNPLKMFEYMASGRPIVSVKIPEAMQYGDVISIAATKQEFCHAIEWELNNDNDQRKAKRLHIASEQSWERHGEQLGELIEATICEKRESTL